MPSWLGVTSTSRSVVYAWGIGLVLCPTYLRCSKRPSKILKCPSDDRITLSFLLRVFASTPLSDLHHFLTCAVSFSVYRPFAWCAIYKMLFVCCVGSGSSAAIDLTMRNDPGSPAARPPTRHRRRWPALASTGVLCRRVGMFPLHGFSITGGNEMMYPCNDASTRRFVSLYFITLQKTLDRPSFLPLCCRLLEHEAPSGTDQYCKNMHHDLPHCVIR